MGKVVTGERAVSGGGESTQSEDQVGGRTRDAQEDGSDAGFADEGQWFMRQAAIPGERVRVICLT